MTTHTHPEIQSDILEMSKAVTSEIGSSEERLRSDMYKIKDELSGRMDSLESDIKAIKDFLLPPKP
jgi:hypothetical protein